MKWLNKMQSRRVGLEALAALIFYTVIGGNLVVEGRVVRLTYLLIAYIVVKYLYQVEGRFSIGMALGLLAVTALMLVMGDRPRAEWAAEATYTFLVIGVIWMIGELAFQKEPIGEEEAVENLNKEGHDTRMARRQQKITYRNDALYWRRRLLALAAVLLLVVAVAYIPGRLKKLSVAKRSSKVKKTGPAITWERNGKKLADKKVIPKPKPKPAAAEEPVESTPTIQILNGNGLPQEAGRIAGVINQNHLGDTSVADLSGHNQMETVIRYRPEHKKGATAVAKSLAAEYPAKLTADLDAAAPADIMVVLGLDKIGLIDKNKLQIAVKNGNGRAGAAATAAALLKENGFNNITTGDALDRSSYTRVLANYTDIYAAKVINNIVGKDYQSSIETTAGVSPGTLTVVLGLK